MIRTDMTEKEGQMVPIEDNRAEHWISDGKSIFEFNHTKKQLVEHKLPPELQGKAIANTPLPFLFGAEAQKLKQRYFIRLVTPGGVNGQIWFEAFPRFQQDAANFHHAQFIINAQDMSPFALKLIQPNEKDYMVYQFFSIVVNNPLRLFQGDPFRAYTPVGWQKIVEEPPAPTQAARPQQADGQR
jgi:TIGR03009 family protein